MIYYTVFFVSARVSLKIENLKFHLKKKKTLVSSKEETGGIIILEITSHLLFLIRATKYLY